MPQNDRVLLDAARREALIQALCRRLRDHYVFPEVAATLEAALQTNLRSGGYDGVTSGAALAELLTAQLQACGNDRHLRLIYHEQGLPAYENAYTDPAWLDEERQAGRLNNFGFRRVERLPGNVGYLEHAGYFYDPADAGDTVVGAMSLLAHTSACIIDLRGNRGGESAMVALLCTYLLPARPTHLNSFYTRDTDSIEQSWTLPYIPGRRYDTRPLYIMTGKRTFSAGEELAYNLKHLGRATIVGEPTRGGAHPREQYQIDPHFELALPNARAINPLTGTNWEGVGVTPDILVPEEQALPRAYAEALRAVLHSLAGAGSGPLQALRAEAQSALAALEHEAA